MKKKGIFLLCSLFFLTSCNANVDSIESVENKYIDLVPYLNMEKNEEATFAPISSTQYVEKMIAKDTFVCLFHTESCSSCKRAKENFLIPYMQETKIKIYTLDVYEETNYSNLLSVKNYQPEDSTYIRYNDSNTLVATRPVLQIVEEGKVKAYELGSSQNLVNLLDAYCIK